LWVTETRTGASSIGKNQSDRGEFRLMAAPLYPPGWDKYGGRVENFFLF
jgi:hypothetical protein